MEIKAIIFDMDGTIIDTSEIWFKATKSLILSKGINLTPELEMQLCKEIHGLNLSNACKIIKDIANIDEPIENLMRQKSEIACKLYGQGIKFIEGFENFHAQIKAKNIKHAIATNADVETLRIAKKILKIENFFGNHIYDISCVNNIGKPNPIIYLHASAKLDVDPKFCIAIEDSAHGIQAAKSAGMRCIGINTSKNRESLRESDFIIEGYHELDLQKLLKNNYFLN